MITLSIDLSDLFCNLVHYFLLPQPFGVHLAGYLTVWLLCYPAAVQDFCLRCETRLCHGFSIPGNCWEKGVKGQNISVLCSSVQSLLYGGAYVTRPMLIRRFEANVLHNWKSFESCSSSKYSLLHVITKCFSVCCQIPNIVIIKSKQRCGGEDFLFKCFLIDIYKHSFFFLVNLSPAFAYI